VGQKAAEQRRPLARAVGQDLRHQAAVEWVPNAADQLLKSDPERVDALIERWLIAADRLPNV
jgi:hypothetical protein